MVGLGLGTAIDFRPLTESSMEFPTLSRLYVLNLNTGAATLVGSGAFTRK